MTKVNIDLGPAVQIFLMTKLDNELTRRTYRQGLFKFLGFVGKKISRRPGLLDWKREHIVAFRDAEAQRISAETGKPISNSTLILALAAIKRFDAAISAHYGTPLQFVDIAPVNPSQREIRGLTYEEYAEIVKHLDSLPSDFRSARTRFAFFLAIDTALRVSEMVRLVEGQIDFTNDRFSQVLISKRKKLRLNRVIIGRLKGELVSYLPHRDKQLHRRFKRFGRDWHQLSDAERLQYPLLISQQGTPGKPETFALTERNYHSVIYRLGKKLGIHMHPHKLRHTNARFALDAGDSERDVADRLGHAGLNQVMRYTATTDAERRNKGEMIYEHITRKIAGAAG